MSYVLGVFIDEVMRRPRWRPHHATFQVITGVKNLQLRKDTVSLLSCPITLSESGPFFFYFHNKCECGRLTLFSSLLGICFLAAVDGGSNENGVEMSFIKSVTSNWGGERNSQQ